MQAKVPPGPRLPRAIQTAAWLTRPFPFLEQCRARYGKRFTMHILGAPKFCHISTPDEVRELFQTAPDVLHPGEGARILEPLVGKNSLILLDEDPHLEQRKLMLPAFHGQKMQNLKGLMTEVAERAVDRWPRNDAAPLHPHLQDVTLEIILRAVFGLDEGERLERLRHLLNRILDLGTRPASMIPALHRNLGPLTHFRRFAEYRAEADEMIFELIDERRSDSGAERGDILEMLLAARHEDGSPMSPQELRDELMTLLTAGHETTASQLAWTFERLTREPRVVRRLTEEIDAGDGDEYLTATVQETLRRRPVLPNAEPRLVMEEVEIGGWRYPTGVCVLADIYLLHHDADVYDEPYAFRPERFLEEQPGTYTWIPFGGGRRRCIGAAFATLEMKIVLRAVLERADISAGVDGLERTRRRAITVSPRLGAPTALRDRVREPAGAAASHRDTRAA